MDGQNKDMDTTSKGSSASHLVRGEGGALAQMRLCLCGTNNSVKNGAICLGVVSK